MSNASKKAIAYVRISDKDQSNFSLGGQEDEIRRFAEKNGYQVVALYCDDGKSAKNFDRPDWKNLQDFCRQNQTDIDALIVAKYDRFSRNLKEALSMIETLEEKYSIRILSAREPIMMNPNSPYFFQFRTQMLLGAQVEWLIIKDRTKNGNYNAALAGRYITVAPVGYLNRRDESNKPIIVINEAMAPTIRLMFQMADQLAPLKEIRLQAMRAGYPKRGHEAVKETLTNPVYAGYIRVPAYGEDPGGWLKKGLHEAIVEPSLWHRVQDILNPKTRSRTVMNEIVPLRSVLRCFCGRALTAGESQGRKKKYWYYRCPNHSNVNLPIDKLHDQLEDLLQELSLRSHHVTYLKNAILQSIDERMKDQEALLQDKKREFVATGIKLDNVEEKFIEGHLDGDTYKKWRARYQSEMAVINQYIDDLSQPVDRLRHEYETRLPYLTNLLWFYQKADLHQKQALVRMVFNNTLYYQGGVYRTAYVPPVFLAKATSLKEKGLLEIDEAIEKMPNVQNVPPTGSQLNQVRELLGLLAQIKAA